MPRTCDLISFSSSIVKNNKLSKAGLASYVVFDLLVKYPIEAVKEFTFSRSLTADNMSELYEFNFSPVPEIKPKQQDGEFHWRQFLDLVGLGCQLYTKFSTFFTLETTVLLIENHIVVHVFVFLWNHLQFLEFISLAFP